MNGAAGGLHVPLCRDDRSWGAGSDNHPGVCAPLTGTPGPANARSDQTQAGQPTKVGTSPIPRTYSVDNEATFATLSLLSLGGGSPHLSGSTAFCPVLMTRYESGTRHPCQGTVQGIASGIGADSASAASCRTGVIQYAVPHVPPLLRSFPILIVKHHEQQDVEVRNSK